MSSGNNRLAYRMLGLGKSVAAERIERRQRKRQREYEAFKARQASGKLAIR